jgi:hypothetical protein
MNCGIIITMAILASEIRAKKNKVMTLEDIVHHPALEDMGHHMAMEHPVDPAAVMALTTDVITISSEKKLCLCSHIFSFSISCKNILIILINKFQQIFMKLLCRIRMSF